MPWVTACMWETSPKSAIISSGWLSFNQIGDAMNRHHVLSSLDQGHQTWLAGKSLKIIELNGGFSSKPGLIAGWYMLSDVRYVSITFYVTDSSLSFHHTPSLLVRSHPVVCFFDVTDFPPWGCLVHWLLGLYLKINGKFYRLRFYRLHHHVGWLISNVGGEVWTQLSTVTSHDYYYHLGGGLEPFLFSIYWEFHHPNWLSYFFRGVGWNRQPTVIL